MLELYHDWISFCSIKVRLCLAEKNLPWESRYVELMKLQHLEPAYLKLNPNALVPTLVHDGKIVLESTIINEYLDEVFPEVKLSPQDPVERATMRYWVKFEDDVLHPAVRPATFNLMIRHAVSKLPRDYLDKMLAHHPTPARAANYRAAGTQPFDRAAVEGARAQMNGALAKLERRLTETKWLAGSTYSLADVAAAPFIDRLEELAFFGLWDDKPAVKDWIARLKARPAYKLAIPQTKHRLPVAE
ncbi:MAG: glutathione S-transferase family protein [Alphaproteobacteria bacterium]